MQQISDWLSRLVRVPSVNSAQAQGDASIAGEGRMAQCVAQAFEALGGQVYRDEVLPQRSNVYGIWRGSSQRWLAIDAHMDTVGVSAMSGDPFSGTMADGRVYGRGSVDTKATMAIALALLEQWRASGRPLKHNLLLAATVDEEVGATGAPVFARWLSQKGIVLDELIVAEPTLCRPAYGHKGVVRIAFDIEGQAAHSSQPQHGKNAISDGARLVCALDEECRRLGHLSWPSELGPPTLTVTLIEGGTGINLVPANCRVSIDYRVAPGQKAQEVCRELEALAAKTCRLPVAANRLLALDPFYQPPDSPFIQKMQRFSGNNGITVSYGTNAWQYGEHPNIKACVVMGPGSIDQAHGREEWVTLGELEKQANVMKQWLEIDA